MTIRIDGTNTAANPGITGSDTDTGLQFGTDEVNIVTGATTRATVDSSGRLLVGTSTARSNFFNTGNFRPHIQLEGTDSESSRLTLVRNQNNSGGPGLVLGKSRGSSAGSVTIAQNNDDLGLISFQGGDGSGLVEAARIQVDVDGTPGADDMPGRLVFSTTADGASSPTERMRITSTGDLRFNSGYGSVATAYGVRAWVNFQGTGTVDIRQHGNVSSITDVGTGKYRVNFSNSMPDDDYSAVVSVIKDNNTDNGDLYGCLGAISATNRVPTTSYVPITTVRLYSVTLVDTPIVSVVVIR